MKKLYQSPQKNKHVGLYRGQKIARVLFDKRLDGFRKKGITIGVVRTKRSPVPSVTYSWYIKLGYQVVAEYPENDGRVVLAKRLSELD